MEEICRSLWEYDVNGIQYGFNIRLSQYLQNRLKSNKKGRSAVISSNALIEMGFVAKSGLLVIDEPGSRGSNRGYL